MSGRSTLLDALGGEAGCLRLSSEFYARVGKDPVLRPLFPGKSLRCATEAFASFLIQFLGGDEAQTQHRSSLSLRHSHARFRIGEAERSAWLKHMGATLEAAPLDEGTRSAFRQFFLDSSAYVAGKEESGTVHAELVARWGEQRALDDIVAAIFAVHDQDVLAMAPRFASQPSVFVGLLARMIASRRSELIRFAVDAVEKTPDLASHRFAGRTLMHFASAAGCLEMVELLLRLGFDPDTKDLGGHTALYAVANGCSSAAGPAIVRMLVEAGADVNACGGVTRATPLHMAARRGFLGIAATLLDSGSAIDAKDTKGDTPRQRALTCRRLAVAQLLANRGGAAGSRGQRSG